MKSPIIIIGMHRSGTTLVTKLLEEFGVFVGRNLGKNYESKFFLDLNEWVFKQANATWDRPTGMCDLMKNNKTRNLIVDYLDIKLSSPQAKNFFGIKQLYRYKSIKNIDYPWGWKDPRNTFTLPLWLELFPSAKIICVDRHGVDVAQSLKVRAESMLLNSNNKYYKKRPVYAVGNKKGLFTHSVRSLSLKGGLSLWDEYMVESKLHIENINNPVHKLKYEDLLEEPIGTIALILEFCGIVATHDEIALVAKNIHRERANAYTKVSELIEFQKKNSDVLSKHGY